MPRAPRKKANATSDTTTDALKDPPGRKTHFVWTADHIANLQGLASIDLGLNDIVEALNERFPDMAFTKHVVNNMRNKLKADLTGNKTVQKTRSSDMTNEARADLLNWANEGWKYREVGEKLQAKYGILKNDTTISAMLKKMGFPGAKNYVRPWEDDVNRELVLLYGETPTLNPWQMAMRLEAKFGLPFQGMMVQAQVMRLKARGEL